MIGPAVGLLVPSAIAAETAPLGTPASAERYSMPGVHFDPETGSDLASGPGAREP